MISRRIARWQQAAALAPVLLLLVYLPGEMMVRCRMDGLLRSACCCPQETERQDPGPIARAQDCCGREMTESQRPAAEAARPAGRDLTNLTAITTIAVVAAPVPLATSPTERPDWAWQRHGPAREGPALVLLKHAFLI